MRKNKKKKQRRKRVALGCFGVPFLLLLCIGIWLIRGIPGAWVTPWIEPRLPEGFQLHASEFRMSPGKGFLLTELRMYSPNDRVTPLVEADELWVNPHLWKWVREKEWASTGEMKNGSVYTNLGIWADDLVTDQELKLDQLNGSWEMKSRRVVIPEFTAALPNMKLVLSGEYRYDVPEVSEEPQRRTLTRTAQIIAEAMVYVENFQFEHKPELTVSVSPSDLDEYSPRLEFSIQHASGQSRHRGFEFEEIGADAVYEDKILKVSSFLVKENSERSLSGTAWVNFEKDLYEVNISNTLRRFGLEAVSPFSLGSLLDNLRLRLEDRVDFELKIGPNSFARPGDHLAGELFIENGFYRDTFFPELKLQLNWENPQFSLSGIEGVIGQQSGSGPIEGDVEINFNRGYIRLDVKGAFYPDLAVSMVGARTEKYIREWEFRGPPPSFTANFLKKENGQPAIFSITGEAEKALWRGTAFDRISSRVDYRNERLSIREAKAERGKERFEGEFLFLPLFQGCEFKVESNFYLPDIAQLLGEKVTSIIRPFRFRGRSVLSASGYIDMAQKGDHRITGTYEFTDVVWQWLSINSLTGSVKLEDGNLELPDILAEMEGGEMNANFRAADAFSNEGQFALAMQLSDMDLYKVISKATDLEDTPYRGELSLNLTLVGALRNTEQTPKTDTFRGAGSLDIVEGSLFRIPLLLGLSEILSKIVKGFGYASQSDFSTEFKIADGKISSDKLFLKGDVMSVAGPGWYRFKDKKISADMKIHLFKEGVLTDALKLILWPIRKLVEVQLTGTLDNPDWQPKNLPKEIFGK